MREPLKLYDLAGADERVRFSPNCWRTRFALAHKGLPCETVVWRFMEKDAIAFSGQGKVPVLVDGTRHVHDSWTIALYLEDTYPDRPSLFGGAAGRGLARFVNQWTSEVLHPAIAKVVLPDLVDILHEGDRDYYRSTREAAFGTTVGALRAAREDNVNALRTTLRPLRSTLADQKFLAGDAPNYADHVAFSAFLWAHASSPVKILAADDTLHARCGRMFDAYDGLARLLPVAA